MNKNQKKKILYEMIRMREVELRISSEYSKEEMRCPIHLSVGQEAIPVAISNNLKKQDKVLSAHRSHFHYLAKGGSLKMMISELYGKDTGCARGLGGSMHLIDIDANIVAAVPIVGSTLPIGAGVAWSQKLKKNKNITVIYFGDGATEEGVFQESLDFASLFNLRILFVCENNFFSVYSNIKKRQHARRSIINIASSHGVKSLKINGNDCESIFDKSKKIVKQMRSDSRPFLIQLDTYRHLEHCGPNYDDNLEYRDTKEVVRWLKKDPINSMMNKMKKENLITNKDISIFKKRIDKELDNAFDFAKKSKFPSKILLTKYVYS